MKVRLGLAVLLGLFFALGLPRAAPAEEPAKYPEYGASVRYLDQGWSQDTANWWYYISQGTVFIPYDWFLALEQAEGRELFAAPGHMMRLGFLVDPPHPQYNPDGLPVGFARKELDFAVGPGACHKGQWVGLACAACHTGQVNFRGHQIRIEGGAAHHDIETFQVRLGEALNALGASEVKRSRFAARVLARQPGQTPETLLKEFACYADFVRGSKAFFEAAQAAAPELPTASGFGRLDAHERGVNLFLAAPLREPRNYVPETAPVSFPAMWDTPYFDWVLYNAAVRQPLARNVIEALGVQASIDHRTIFQDKAAHSLEMQNIAKGQRAMMDLTSPAWPEDILGAIDRDKAARGGAPYQANCAGCHEVIDPAVHAAAGADTAGQDHRIKVKTMPLAAIGTDGRQAETFARREVDLTKIGGPAGLKSFAAGQAVTEKITQQWIAEAPENAALAAEINQGRPNEFRGELVYRARPLNGIWAMAPYLHNGSVASLTQLLTPASRRDKILYMGNWDFNPADVGYETSSPFTGASVLDTRLPGNSNAGHEYGTGLDAADRAALIEYLKTL